MAGTADAAARRLCRSDPADALRAHRLGQRACLCQRRDLLRQLAPDRRARRQSAHVPRITVGASVRADVDVAHVSDEPSRRAARRGAAGVAGPPLPRTPLRRRGAQGIVTPTIFISVAAYREFDLVNTLRDCLAQADDAARLRICLCWQHADGDSLEGVESDPRVTVIDVPYAESRGVCWARNLI